MQNETRRFPAATVPCLRVQVGRMETRVLQEPVYTMEKSARGGMTGRLMGHEVTAETGATFHLLGFGATVAAAEAMAQRAGKHPTTNIEHPTSNIGK
jgi:hypothetical protein